MSLTERFAQYAAAFEEVYKKDDWSLLDEYFTEDAVYETFADPPFGGVLEGRDAIFSQLKTILDTFDRRFESRDLELLDGPNEQDGAVWVRWRVVYRVGTAPALVVEGEETANFEGDRIRRLEDRFTDESVKEVTRWLEEHGSQMKPAPAEQA